MLGEFFSNLASNRDPVTLDQRVAQFEGGILPNLATITQGRISADRLTRANAILDVGCGRGALGAYLRDKGMQGVIIGVDDDEPSGENARGQYTKVIPERIESHRTLNELKKYTFDYILAMGVPRQVAEFIAKFKSRFNLSKDGVICIVSDRVLDAGKFADFGYYTGNVISSFQKEDEIFLYP